MRKLILAAVIGLSSVFIAPVGALAAQPPTGRQPLPDAACDAPGASNARYNHHDREDPAWDFLPHYHDNEQGVPTCYHANPTYPPA